MSFHFDSRAQLLGDPQNNWKQDIKKQHEENKNKIITSLREEHGEVNLEAKILNFKELKSKPFSIVTFHNKFLDQIRTAFVMGSYYPALVASCTLGELILNHLILLLRDYHKKSTDYKKVYRKKSFNDWKLAIDALEAWNELLPPVANKFRELNTKRNDAVHFRPETGHDDRQLALDAVLLVQEIVMVQFSTFGKQPWCFMTPGEVYIKKEWEDKPFVKNIFIEVGT